MSWSDTYIGIPWRAGGRHEDGKPGLDCWGLLRRIYADQLSVVLPSFDGVDALNGPAIAREMQAGMEAWRKVDAPQPFDGVLLRKGRDLCHVGVVVKPGWFIHVDEGITAQLARPDAPLWRARSTFYRHVSQ